MSYQPSTNPSIPESAATPHLRLLFDTQRQSEPSDERLSHKQGCCKEACDGCRHKPECTDWVLCCSNAPFGCNYKFFCPRCKQGYTRPIHVAEHVYSKHLGIRYGCICEREYSTPAELKEHMKQARKVEGKKNEQEGKIDGQAIIKHEVQVTLAVLDTYRQYWDPPSATNMLRSAKPPSEIKKVLKGQPIVQTCPSEHLENWSLGSRNSYNTARSLADFQNHVKRKLREIPSIMPTLAPSSSATRSTSSLRLRKPTSKRRGQYPVGVYAPGSLAPPTTAPSTASQDVAIAADAKDLHDTLDDEIGTMSAEMQDIFTRDYQPELDLSTVASRPDQHESDWLDEYIRWKYCETHDMLKPSDQQASQGGDC